MFDTFPTLNYMDQAIDSPQIRHRRIPPPQPPILILGASAMTITSHEGKGNEQPPRIDVHVGDALEAEEQGGEHEEAGRRCRRRPGQPSRCEECGVGEGRGDLTTVSSNEAPLRCDGPGRCRGRLANCMDRTAGEGCT